jgi:MraZ protein
VFRGHFRHGIDPKGRVSIPARFRDVLRDSAEGAVVIARGDECLEVHPLSRWSEMEQRLLAMPEFDEAVEDYQRYYVSRGLDTAVDPQGRILVPPDYRSYAGLDKEVLIVGMSTRFELWDPERWDASERTHAPKPSQMRARLAAKLRAMEHGRLADQRP